MLLHIQRKKFFDQLKSKLPVHDFSWCKPCDRVVHDFSWCKPCNRVDGLGENSGIHLEWTKSTPFHGWNFVLIDFWMVHTPTHHQQQHYFGMTLPFCAVMIWIQWLWSWESWWSGFCSSCVFQQTLHQWFYPHQPTYSDEDETKIGFLVVLWYWWIHTSSKWTCNSKPIDILHSWRYSWLWTKYICTHPSRLALHENLYFSPHYKLWQEALLKLCVMGTLS